MSDTSFVYVTYIRTTPEKLWQGLTTREFLLAHLPAGVERGVRLDGGAVGLGLTGHPGWAAVPRARCGPA